jgi:hypothetical protein
MKTIAFYFATPYEGGFMELIGDDGEPLRAETREELMERLDEAKNYLADCEQQGLAVEGNLFLVKEELTAEEITE